MAKIEEDCYCFNNSKQSILKKDHIINSMHQSKGVCFYLNDYIYELVKYRITKSRLLLPALFIGYWVCKCSLGLQGGSITISKTIGSFYHNFFSANRGPGKENMVGQCRFYKLEFLRKLWPAIQFHCQWVPGNTLLHIRLHWLPVLVFPTMHQLIPGFLESFYVASILVLCIRSCLKILMGERSATVIVSFRIGKHLLKPWQTSIYS